MFNERGVCPGSLNIGHWTLNISAPCPAGLPLAVHSLESPWQRSHWRSRIRET